MMTKICIEKRIMNLFKLPKCFTSSSKVTVFELHKSIYPKIENRKHQMRISKYEKGSEISLQNSRI